MQHNYKFTNIHSQFFQIAIFFQFVWFFPRRLKFSTQVILPDFYTRKCDDPNFTNSCLSYRHSSRPIYRTHILLDGEGLITKLLVSVVHMCDLDYWRFIYFGIYYFCSLRCLMHQIFFVERKDPPVSFCPFMCLCAHIYIYSTSKYNF